MAELIWSSIIVSLKSPRSNCHSTIGQSNSVKKIGPYVIRSWHRCAFLRRLGGAATGHHGDGTLWKSRHSGGRQLRTSAQVSSPRNGPTRCHQEVYREWRGQGRQEDCYAWNPHAKGETRLAVVVARCYAIGHIRSRDCILSNGGKYLFGGANLFVTHEVNFV